MAARRNIPSGRIHMGIFGWCMFSRYVILKRLRTCARASCVLASVFAGLVSGACLRRAISRTIHV